MIRVLYIYGEKKHTYFTKINFTYIEIHNIKITNKKYLLNYYWHNYLLLFLAAAALPAESEIAGPIPVEDHFCACTHIW